jgi:hypothetical protein
VAVVLTENYKREMELFEQIFKLLIEYPQYRFYIPFIDETFKNESPITLYVPIRGYQRVVEKSALTNREIQIREPTPRKSVPSCRPSAANGSRQSN